MYNEWEKVGNNVYWQIEKYWESKINFRLQIAENTEVDIYERALASYNKDCKEMQ